MTEMVPLSAWDGEWCTPPIEKRTFEIKRVGARYQMSQLESYPTAIRNAVWDLNRACQREMEKGNMTRIGQANPEVVIYVDARAVDRAAGLQDGDEVEGHHVVALWSRWHK